MEALDELRGVSVAALMATHRAYVASREELEALRRAPERFEAVAPTAPAR